MKSMRKRHDGGVQGEGGAGGVAGGKDPDRAVQRVRGSRQPDPAMAPGFWRGCRIRAASLRGFPWAGNRLDLMNADEGKNRVERTLFPGRST